MGSDSGSPAHSEFDVDPGDFTVITSAVDLLEYPELDMEAVSKVDIVESPASIVVEGKGNELFSQIPMLS